MFYCLKAGQCVDLTDCTACYRIEACAALARTSTSQSIVYVCDGTNTISSSMDAVLVSGHASTSTVASGSFFVFRN
ncbi:hypothetical protein DPMN_081226 [Dreissena polymorpha]|uniref:Uncharacterized protein n=1 Tax=Dreissena polymorpha TaxID=45954 RepID=A0A9D4B908_DREPO|nr:hypothetical protein DPMN_081226 [Dreissena polymorpha]